MGSDAMTYILHFIKFGSGIQELLRGIRIQTQTYRQQVELTSLLLFFQNKESRLTSGDLL
jgi:hypothetical protein